MIAIDKSDAYAGAPSICCVYAGVSSICCAYAGVSSICCAYAGAPSICCAYAGVTFTLMMLPDELWPKHTRFKVKTTWLIKTENSKR